MNFADEGIELMKTGEFAAALPLLLRAIENDPSHYGNWYMAGQCFRFTNDLPKAVKHLVKASELAPREAPVFLALGIALQLSKRLDEATAALVCALKIDSNYELAYNSLALTHMKKGNFEYALDNYDEALKAMTRRIVCSFNNSSGRGIIKHHDSTHMLWSEYAMFGAMFIASSDKTIEKLAWPSGEGARDEECSEVNEGLFWADKFDVSGTKVRLFMPNYFNTFRSRLIEDNSYSMFLRAKGTALEELGRISEAHEHYEEAKDFRSGL